MESGALHTAVIPLGIVAFGIVWNAGCYRIAGNWAAKSDARPEPADRLRICGWIIYGMSLVAAAVVFLFKLS
ncbi:hypothetical protein Enr8_50850 [Blastopirellula retiformator]|uniref:Uncharacterized protein n=1 Tax=Blastopirellula retiformator TaxID=2527970 RepID=A0A5C5USD2_9BACT|nr:hypothetical protein Enr8_50850 [Blastopirellula retiformator]